MNPAVLVVQSAFALSFLRALLAKISLTSLQDKFGYLLKEVSLSKESFPYEYYSADRFGVLVDQSLETVAEMEELLEEEFSI